MGWTLCKKELPETYSVLCVDCYGEMLFGHPFEDESSNTGYSAESDEVYMYNCLAWQEVNVNIPQLFEEEQKYKEATK
jgi:hypothetical protein